MAIDKKNNNKLEKELFQVIQKIVENNKHDINVKEIKDIIPDIISEFDEIISVKVTQHFKELAKFILKTLK